MTNTTKPTPALKGVYNGNCNREACQAAKAVWYNHSTRKYYCHDCALYINRYRPSNDEYLSSLPHLLLTQGEHQPPGAPKEKYLTATRVHQLLLSCLYDDSDIENGALKSTALPAVQVHACRLKIGFNPNKLAEATEAIKATLKELPHFFHLNQYVKNGGDGSSFLTMCMDAEGNQWGEHRNCDELLALGLAIDCVEFPMERALWSCLPGGMPFVATTRMLWL